MEQDSHRETAVLEPFFVDSVVLAALEPTVLPEIAVGMPRQELALPFAALQEETVLYLPHRVRK